MKDMAPTVAHCVCFLPPEGAAFRLGTARRRNRAPTLPRCAWSLPPGGAAFRLGTAQRRNIRAW